MPEIPLHPSYILDMLHSRSGLSIKRKINQEQHECHKAFNQINYVIYNVKKYLSFYNIKHYTTYFKITTCESYFLVLCWKGGRINNLILLNLIYCICMYKVFWFN